MLGKLIRYDFKAIAKNMFPVYGLMIVMMLICTLMIRFNLDRGFLFTFFIMIQGFLLSASFAVTIICIVMRFYNGLLRNEGYLSFALPVDTSTHILAKVINSIIWSAIEVAALLVCAAIYVLILGSIRDIAEIFGAFFRAVDYHFFLDFLQILLLMGEELICVTCLFFAALAIAHLFDKHRKLITGIFILAMFIIRVLLLPVISDFGDFHLFWYLVPLLLILAYSFVTWFVLDKRLNLQ